MKRCIMLLSFIAQLFSGTAQKADFSKYPAYKGTDLGLTYSESKSIFRIWSPTAEEAALLIYSDGDDGCLIPSVG